MTKRKAKKTKVPTQMWVSLVLIIAVIAIGALYNFANVGQVIKAPSPPVDLTTQVSEGLDISQHDEMKAKVKLSGTNAVEEVTIKAVKNKKGQIEYSVTGKSGVQSGLLGNGLSNTGSIYLNSDDKADLELSLAGNILTLTNKNFVTPDLAKIELYSALKNKLPGVVLQAKTKVDNKFFFNVSSTTKPKVKFILDGNEIFPKINSSTTNSVFVEFNVTPTVEKPMKLFVVAEVGGKRTEKEYIVAVNRHFYLLEKAGFPKISLKQIPNAYETTYTFSKTTALQPFALLCGEKSLGTDFANVSTIYSYDKNVQQWKEGKPSEIQKLSANKGYLLRLKKDTTLNFMVSCTQEPKAVIPALDQKWNLLGVSGYETVHLSELQTKTGGKKITALYEYSDKGPVKSSWTKFEPGKVYWVKVE